MRSAGHTDEMLEAGESESTEGADVSWSADNVVSNLEAAERADSAEEELRTQSGEQRDEDHVRVDSAGQVGGGTAREVGREVVAEVYRFTRPLGGGVEEALWWGGVAQAIRELRDQVRSDSDQHDVRSADLRAKQETLQVCRKRDQSQAAKLAETADQIQALVKEAAKNGPGGRDAAKARQRRTLQRAQLEARQEYRRAIQNTKSQQDVVTTAAKIHDAQTRAEGQRLHWLRQLPLLAAAHDGGGGGPVIRGQACDDSADSQSHTSTAAISSDQAPDHRPQARAAVEGRPQAKAKRARSIRFAPLDFHSHGDTVFQMLREGAEVRPYSERGTHAHKDFLDLYEKLSGEGASASEADTSNTNQHVPYSATDGGIQVDLRSLIAEQAPCDPRLGATDTCGTDTCGTAHRVHHDGSTSHRRGGILKGPASTQKTSRGLLVSSPRRTMSARPQSAGGRSGSDAKHSGFTSLISTDRVGMERRPRSAGTATPRALAAHLTPGLIYTTGSAWEPSDLCASAGGRRLESGAHMDSIETDVGTIVVEGRRTALRPHPPSRKLLSSEAWPEYRLGRA